METYEESNATGRALLIFLGGLAVGYGIALLSAPRTGRETRQILTDYAQTTGERISSAARSAMGSARRGGERAAQKAGEYAEEAKAQAASAAQRAAGSVSPQ